MLDPGTYVWQNPMTALVAAMDHLEMARMGLDIASSASAALELVPEAARMPGLEQLHAQILHPMAFQLGEALGAGRWLLAGYVSPEMLGLMAGAMMTAWRTGQAAPRVVEQMVRAAGPEWRGHVGVTREWLGRALASLQSAVAAMQMLMGPRWDEAVHVARPYVTRWVAPELREARPEVRPEAMPMPPAGPMPGAAPAAPAWPGRAEPGRAAAPPVRGAEPAGSQLGSGTGHGPAGREGATEGGGDARPAGGPAA